MVCSFSVRAGAGPKITGSGSSQKGPAPTGSSTLAVLCPLIYPAAKVLSVFFCFHLLLLLCLQYTNQCCGDGAGWSQPFLAGAKASEFWTGSGSDPINTEHV